MKSAELPSYTDSEKATRRLMEHAQPLEPIQDGRIYIERINGPFPVQQSLSAVFFSVGLAPWAS